MELIRGIHNLSARHQGCVLSIGNFDGVHLGHQAVLTQLKHKANELGLPAVVMSFEPQPLEVIRPAAAPARLTRLRDKYHQLAKVGIDRLLAVIFNLHFAQMEAEAFIEALLVKQLGVKYLVVGDDFCFGRGRRGNFAMLQRAGEVFGFEVVSTKSFCLQGQRVSSTAIREALASDRLDDAKSLLGRPYSINGRVSHGRKLGRTIGFPTANVPLKRLVSPVNGVYAVTVMFEGNAWPGVANIGNRPTVDGIRQQLEVHLFDFHQDLYGQQIEVILRHKLRDEEKFASFEELKAQIERDAQQARQWLADNNNVN
uniref:bifunctional riboflavin kinase/FAD synthetase n=1 Tax=Thaumasiovibrio occultus TaxID=1891184 RepID=UPI000B351A84|nr:bifunctional riboflavin kinase/FAD synthetase [Thaumasiovibrio occultus]